jgi:hypothetical protein
MQIETRAISLQAPQDVKLRAWLTLPPGIYRGTEERIRTDSIGGPSWAVNTRSRLRERACQHGRNRTAKSEFGRNLRDRVCTLGAVETSSSVPPHISPASRTSRHSETRRRSRPSSSNVATSSEVRVSKRARPFRRRSTALSAQTSSHRNSWRLYWRGGRP